MLAKAPPEDRRSNKARLVRALFILQEWSLLNVDFLALVGSPILWLYHLLKPPEWLDGFQTTIPGTRSLLKQVIPRTPC